TVLTAGLLSTAVVGPGDPRPDFAKRPGGGIAHSPAASRGYPRSPSITNLPGGAHPAPHDLFCPNSTEHTSAATRVYRSTDRGRTWSHVTDIQGAFWSTVFVHRGEVYLLGTTKHHGDAVIRRSSDSGKTWTTPSDGNSGLLRAGQYHCAPVPVVV